MARKSGGKWYVAAINGMDEILDVTVDWNRLKVKKGLFSVYGDSGNADALWSLSEAERLPSSLHLLPRGGMVMVEE